MFGDGKERSIAKHTQPSNLSLPSPNTHNHQISPCHRQTHTTIKSLLAIAKHTQPSNLSLPNTHNHQISPCRSGCKGALELQADCTGTVGNQELRIDALSTQLLIVKPSHTLHTYQGTNCFQFESNN